MDLIEYYLKNSEERVMIAEQGYRMVHENHTTAIRAEQLVTMIKDILVKHKPKSSTILKIEKAKLSVAKKGNKRKTAPAFVSNKINQNSKKKVIRKKPKNGKAVRSTKKSWFS